MNYHEAIEKLAGREKRKLENNTYLEKRASGAIAVRLHATDVVTFEPSGTITLNSGGWLTHTTKARINDYLPDNWYITQEKGVWYLVSRKDNARLGRYQDGLKIRANESIENILPLIKKMEGIDRNLKRKIKTYCVGFMEALEAGHVKQSNGDCWYCLLRETDTKRPLGELTKSDHIEEHIKDGYYVFSMLERAFEIFGASIAMRGYVGECLNGNRGNVFAVDFIKEQSTRALYKYICRQYGYAV